MARFYISQLDAVAQLEFLLGTGVENNVVARAGGGKALAQTLSANHLTHRVSTVATAADSILLPPADAASIGLTRWVINDGANAMQVFGAGTDTINGVATGTGVSQSAGTRALYKYFAVGQIYRILGA